MTPAGKAIAVFTTNELNVRIAEDSSNRCGLKVLIEIFSFLRDAVDVFLFDLPATGHKGPRCHTLKRMRLRFTDRNIEP
jgi:hypothetical protein